MKLKNRNKSALLLIGFSSILIVGIAFNAPKIRLNRSGQLFTFPEMLIQNRGIDLSRTFSHKPGVVYEGNNSRTIDIANSNHVLNIKLKNKEVWRERSDINFYQVEQATAMARVYAIVLAKRMGLIINDIQWVALANDEGLIQELEIQSPLDKLFLQRQNRGEGMIIEPKQLKKREFFDSKNWLSHAHDETRPQFESLLQEMLNIFNRTENISWSKLNRLMDVTSFVKWIVLKDVIRSLNSNIKLKPVLCWDFSRGRWEWMADFYRNSDDQSNAMNDIEQQLLNIDQIKKIKSYVMHELKEDDAPRVLNKWQEGLRDLGLASETSDIDPLQNIDLFDDQANTETFPETRYLPEIDMEQMLPSHYWYGLQVLGPPALNIANAEYISADQIQIRDIPSGVYNVKDNWYIPKHLKVRIGENTVFLLSPGVSIIVDGIIQINGEPKKAVIFDSFDKQNPWGSIIIRGRGVGMDTNYMHHVKIVGGSQTVIESVEYTAALSVYDQDIFLSDVEFVNNYGDDAFNARYSNVTMIDCAFGTNQGDAMDLDFSKGSVTRTFFTRNKDDGIDLSFSSTLIQDTGVMFSGDKGISIGEKSNPIISNSRFLDNGIGIAVKDLSYPKIINAILKGNQIGVALYQKKKSFGPPHATIQSPIFENNLFDYKRSGLLKTDNPLNELLQTK